MVTMLEFGLLSMWMPQIASMMYAWESRSSWKCSWGLCEVGGRGCGRVPLGMWCMVGVGWMGRGGLGGD